MIHKLILKNFKKVKDETFLFNNIDFVRTQESPYILYIEGEDDERILSAWANVL